MNLLKHRDKLIAARDEMSRTIAAIDTVLAYMGLGTGKRIGRPPNVKNSKVGDEKTGVKKSTLTKPFKPKKIKKKGKRLMSPEGEARRRAGYFAYQERMKKQRAQAKFEKEEFLRLAKGGRKPAGKAQSAAA